MKRSIRFRLTAWYALILTAALALFGGLLWLSLQQRLIGEIDRELEGRADRFERFLRAEAVELGGAHLRSELEEFSQALPPANAIHLRGTSGFTFDYPESRSSPPANSRIVRRQFTVKGEQFSLDLDAPVGDVLHTLDLLRLLLISLIPVVVVVSGIAGLWLSGRALKPVTDITAAALTISIDNLSERLPVPPTGDEVARLTEVLNTMLARLEGAVKTLSQFVADASHEFRTPLAVIRTTAELALRREREPEAYRASLLEVTAEVDRMMRLLDDLLTLARNNTGASEMPLAPLDVRDVLGEVMSEMQGLAELRQVRVKAELGSQPAPVAGNRAALHRLFMVLMDNALKYSYPDGDVNVAVERGESGVSIRIEDFGAGISEADLPHIFKRFYRANRARSGSGHGLGLALAEGIVRAHGAEISVRSTEGAWTEFRVQFGSYDSRRVLSGNGSA